MKLTCPSCKALADLAEHPACAACGWMPPTHNGVVVLFDRVQPTSGTFGSYLDNYDRIASDDLHSPILDLRYVQRQAANLARAAGDVTGLEILDLGCGQGFLTRTLIAAGAKSVVAVDISSAYLEQLTDHPRVTAIRANAEQLPFRETFDLLVSTDVMEHVLNLGSFLVSINAALRVGGKAIIRVPYRENLLGYSAQAGCKYEFVHLRTFDRRVLHDALAGAGFEVERTWFDGFSLYSPQPFWLAGPRRKAAYIKLQQIVLAKVKHPAVVTGWPWPFASLFMRPAEIVVLARKARRALTQDADAPA